MSVAALKKESTASRSIPRSLSEAFERFASASEQLKREYELLRKDAEELRAQLRVKDEEIKRQERLATLGQTAAAIAHEVRNPVGALKIFISLLQQDLTGQAGPLGLLNQMNGSLAALEGVVCNILEFAKGSHEYTEAHYAIVNLHAIAHEQLQVVALNRPELHIETRMDGSPFVRAAGSKLGRVLYNLCLNAAQAMRSRGTLTVEIHDHDSDAVCIQISDSGPGIPPELIARIFDPFVTSKNEGTGLGLAIVKQIVVQHGGYVRAENRVEGGACFVIVLPRSGVSRSDHTEECHE